MKNRISGFYELRDLKARLESARIKANTFSGGMQEILDLQRELNELQAKQMAERDRQRRDAA
jgi:hypothetical protein